MQNPALSFLLLLSLSIVSECSNLAANHNPIMNSKKSTKLPPCKMCTLFVDSFKKGMETTERNKHDGGDAAWEEQKLGAYKRSEIRLVEIQESLCKDLPLGEDQCHTLAENNEPLLEEWWFKQQDSHPDLRQWLCVDKLSVCCTAGTFGPNCEPCTDCTGNGKCKGDGTRKGNGRCACDRGYTGDRCTECDTDHYESFRDADKLLCSQCHHACDDGGCTSAGPKGCRVCKHGWAMEPELGGCVDINECAKTSHGCTKNQFCVNNEGSYRCLECDKGCNGCTGDGPDECEECAEGFEIIDGMCKGWYTDVLNRTLWYLWWVEHAVFD